MDRLIGVHGFVLAGGRSVRMGTDKALVLFRGRPMIDIALATLREVCAQVSIAGNREDLAAFAPVVSESWQGAGPAAGLVAGLSAAKTPWSLFVPVDVPLVPATLLHRWVRAVVAHGSGVRLSYLSVAGEAQPALCMLHRDCLEELSSAVARGVRQLRQLYAAVDAALSGDAEQGRLWVASVEELLPLGSLSEAASRLLLSNVNRPEELAALEEGSAGLRESGWAEASLGEQRG